MNILKQNILDLFADDGYAPLTIMDMATILKESEEQIKKSLMELKKDFIVYETKKHKFAPLKHFGLYQGIIEVKEKGFGFIKSQDFEDELYVSKDHINGAMNKDKVVFSVVNYNDNEKNEASVVDIVKRNLKKIICVITNKNGERQLKPQDEKLALNVLVNDFGINVVDDVVTIEIVEYLYNDTVRGRIVQTLGNIHDVGIDIKAVALKYDFEQDFPNVVMEELKEIAYNYETTLKEQELSKRPLVNKTIITIDGEDAKDLDDAVSIQKLDNGNYQLGVYIADVSYFVKEDNPLDVEALYRGTSVYLADRVIPMLPHKLSNDLCSLNEKTPKLVIACEMEINNEGLVENYSIFEAIIETKHRMSYTNVNKILDDDIKELKQYRDIFETVHLMQELSVILYEMRYRRGSLNFDIPEAKIIVDSKGKPVDVVLRERGKGEMLIEEFMLIANETVATCITQMDLPFIYRIHDMPSKEKLDTFNRIIKRTNYSLKQKGAKLTTKTLQSLLDEISDKDIGLSTMLLRMMAKAKYSIQNIGHYGLASPCYTHFTSPIRRYPDLLVHRLLRLYLFEGKVDVEDQMKYTRIIINSAEQSSRRERDAIECEYEVNDMKMAEYMEKHIGETYEGTISSVTSFGMFITLPNTIEGLVRVNQMKDDYYQYFDNLMALCGTRTNNVYRLGDKIKVKVVDANKAKREIDFVIAGKKNDNMVKYSYQKHSDHSRGRHETTRRKENRRKK